ncbi:hypothetical protein FNE59_20435 [Bacillus thuringiensis]|uniref:hypothetical protein n=1 Tax=Bacillus cereus group TaxID=86661 RepID=UPI0018F6892F|nr:MULTISPECIES: hypothetical protein [Bacillus cereus group]MBJ7935574.1 hypothetical protein [Bacillus cereus]MDR5047882.1 hypothetical protein [Bacillus thuringiensis]
MESGLTGWLSPDGIFYPCEYGGHMQLAAEQVRSNGKLRKERARIGFEQGTVVHEEEVLKELLWIPMGIPKWGPQPNMDYIFISYLGRTDKQEKWLKEHYGELSLTQQKMVDEYNEDLLFNKKHGID